MRVEYAEIGLIVGGVVIAILAIARSRAGGLQLVLGMIGLGAGWYFRPPGEFEDAIMTMSSSGEVFIKEPAWLGLVSASALLALFGLARTIQGNGASAAEGGPAQNDLRSADADVAAWDRITDKTDAGTLQEYLLRHPDGRFAELARIKLQRLDAKQSAVGEAAPQTAARGAVARETANEGPPPWAATAAADDLLFPSEKVEKAAQPAEPVKPAKPAELVRPAKPAEPARPVRLAEPAAPKDDLFASTVSARRRYPEPQGSAAPLVAFLLVMLAAGGGGGAWWWFNGGASLFDGFFGGREAGKPVEQVAAEGEPLPLPPPNAAPVEQVDATAAADTAPAPVVRTAPPPAYDVEPPTRLKLVLVKGSNVRLRAAPFANEETGVVAVAKPGAALRVIGRVIRPDWLWYQVTMDDGREAFVRSDFTSAPERGPDGPRQQVVSRDAAPDAAPPKAIQQVEFTPPPPLQAPPVQLPVESDQAAGVSPTGDPPAGASSDTAPATEVPASVNDLRPVQPAPSPASSP